MSRDREWIYVCIAESFFVTVIIYTILMGICSSTSDCTGITKWVLNIQALLLLCTLIGLIIMLSIPKQQPVEIAIIESMEEFMQKGGGAADQVDPLSPEPTPTVSNPPPTTYNLHPDILGHSDDRYLMKMTIVYCTSVFTCTIVYLVVFLQAVVFTQPNVTDAPYNKINQNVTTFYHYSEKSNWIYFILGGSSWQLSSSENYTMDISSLPIIGSILFGMVLAYLIVCVFISMYMSYCATPMDSHNPLFMEKRALAILNMHVSHSVPYIVQTVYATCKNNIGDGNNALQLIVIPLLYILLICFGTDIFSRNTSNTLQIIQQIWFCILASIPLFFTLIGSDSTGHTLFIKIISSIITILCILSTTLAYVLPLKIPSAKQFSSFPTKSTIARTFKPTIARKFDTVSSVRPTMFDSVNKNENIKPPIIMASSIFDLSQDWKQRLIPHSSASKSSRYVV